jgi:hypothetical protein
LITLTAERRHAVESLLSRLSGIQSLRVETSDAGDVEGIYAVTTGRFTPEQQTRNIQSAMIAALGLEVPLGLISVVSLKEVEGGGNVAEDDEAAPVPSRRVRLNQIVYQQTGFKVTAYVELEWQGRTLRGSHEDTDTAKGRMMAAARATLDALERLTERRVAFFLEGLETHTTFERTVAVASIRMISEVRKTNLVGCALVEEDPNYSAAQAALSATNRSFTVLMAGPGSPDRGRGTSTTEGEAQERRAMS